jgi:hypothetical protein
MITTIKKVKPMFNGLITTMNRYGSDQKVKGTTLIDSSKANSVKEYQTVVAVGPMVRGIEVGDIVFINPKRYAVMQHKAGSLQDGVIKDNPVIGYNFDIVEIDGVEHLYLQDSDIKFVAEIEEFDPEPSVYIPEKTIIT